MLEPPALENEQIIACLREQYGLTIAEVEFLPLGADANTAVYRVVAEDGAPYFLKLRSGAFDKMSVLLPRFLHDQGVRQIIAPIAAVSGESWGQVDAYRVLLYPFINGQNGWETRLSDEQWIEFGAALKAIHSLTPAPALIDSLQRESYSPKWREIVREYQARVEAETFVEPISAQLAALFKTHRAVIDDIIERAERLGLLLARNRSPEMVICHTDIHMGNLMLTREDALYIVDWDAPILAPKERDLMFIGGGIGENTLPREEALFYQGYGDTQIDPVALAYYRYERIVEDFAAYAEEIFMSDRGDQDRAEGLRRVSSQFLPNAVIDVAYRTDQTRSIS